MSDLFDEIARQASKLNAEERARLAESLLESLQSPISGIEAAWEKETGERVAALSISLATPISSLMSRRTNLSS